MTSKLKAFTLIEHLLVLLISASIIFIGVVQFQNVKDTFIENHFIQAFEARYLYAQKLAIISGNPTSIATNSLNGIVVFNLNSYQSVIEIPNTVTVEGGSSHLTFKAYSGRGGPLRKYIFHLKANKKKVTYTLQMGDLRYAKKEEKL